MSQMTILTGVERRRRWSDEARERIVAEAFAPGSSVSAVARRHDVSTGLIYTWRKTLMSGAAGSTFAEAVVAEDPVGGIGDTEVILVELARGARVRLTASAPPALASAVLQALR